MMGSFLSNTFEQRQPEGDREALRGAGRIQAGEDTRETSLRMMRRRAGVFWCPPSQHG